MSAKPQIELFLENENGSQQVTYPFVEVDHVSLSNGMDINTMIRQDVSMPTVTHEDLSFKVGVGDQDVSSAIVDSSVAEMTIKGKTYQNILPEPSTHVLSNNKEMFKVNEGLDPNIEIVDGVSKSAILSGQTLNYLLPYKSFSCSNPQGYNVEESNIVRTVYDNHVHYSLTLHSGRGTTISFNHAPNKQTTIYAGKTYTLYIPNYTHQNVKNKRLLMRDNNHAYNYTPIKQNSEYFVFTAIEDFDYLGLYQYFDFDSTYLEKTVECNVSQHAVIVEGDYFNQPLPLLEQGLNSCKMPVLTTVGKNLFDVNDSNNLGDSISKEGETLTSITTCPVVFGYNGLDSTKQYTISFDIHKNSNGSPNSLMYSLSDKNVSYTTVENSYNITLKGNYTTGVTTREKVTIKGKGEVWVQAGGDVTFSNIQIEEGSTATSYEPYKTNILHTPEEVVLRSLPNGVCDTLNLVTGEYVQRIEEHVLDGTTNNASRDWNICWTGYSTNTVTFEGYKPIKTLVNTNSSNTTTIPKNFICDTVKVLGFGSMWQNGQAVDREFSITTYTGGQLIFVIEKSKLSSLDVTGLKQWLSQNPITIQYELATPVVKTVDLSSSGNWEKIVLDGSDNENWVFHALESSGKYSYKTNYIEKTSKTSAKGFCDKYKYVENDSRPWVIKENCISILNTNMLHIYNDCKTLAEFKQNLKQNPITLWYQTATHQDSTQVKQPIFFKDGHIQLSSGVDNSLIPTLDYQAKTSNSYVMDLMKNGVWYTMKAKSASGTLGFASSTQPLSTNGKFAVDGASFQNANKLMVINGSVEDLMILEEDLTSKTIPYFKGIKSVFEDESKIEVLSHGKNLFDIEKVARALHSMGNRETIKIENGYKIKALNHGTHNRTKLQLKPNTTYIASFTLAKDPSETLLNFEIYTTVGSSSSAFYVVKEGSFVRTFTTDKTGVVEVRMDGGGNGYTYYTNIQIEESPNVTSYEPYKSNVSKIPLLSPLRSLPNGVCDELIIDRMKKKATLIQRIDKIVFDGKQKWLLWNNNPADVVSGYVYYDPNNMGYEPKSYGYTINDRLPHNSGGHIATVEGARYTNYFTASLHKSRIGAVNVNDTTANSPMFQKWYTENPMTMYYELATPVVTEIDLEGFPYIYKDGHIFLNGEITPVTEIKYSINQQHQIEANNQDLIRHQKEIDYLYNLIGEYVRVDYKNTLLSLNLELK